MTKNELKVSTWLTVVAEIAKSQAALPALGADEKEAQIEFEARLMRNLMLFDPPIGTSEPREALIRIAALAMRMLDEWYPGDGLEL